MRILPLLAVASVLAGAHGALAAEEGQPLPPRQAWAFAGPFGKFDRGQLQRGFKVYREVCGACHGMKLVPFGALAEPGGPGFTEAQARTIAGEYRVSDGPNDRGEMFERPARLSDAILSPDPKEQGDRAARDDAGGGHVLEQVFPRPPHRHAAAIPGRPGGVHRRDADHARAIRAAHLRLSHV